MTGAFDKQSFPTLRHGVAKWETHIGDSWILCNQYFVGLI